MTLDLYYSNTYQEAREKFLTHICDIRHTAKVKEVELQDILSPKKEKLYIDVAYFGNENATKLLIHTSGVHGVEGFAGSAIQSYIIKNGLLEEIDENIAIIFIHIINPYGMAWYRRVNENNVDLNRNITNRGEVQAHPIYYKINNFLNPQSEPWNWNLNFFINAAIAKTKYNGVDLKNAIAVGQNYYTKGLFFSGTKIEQGPKAIINYLKATFKKVEKIVHIDVHTGLGKYGHDTILYNTEHDAIIRKSENLPKGDGYNKEICSFAKAMGSHSQVSSNKGYVAYNTSGTCGYMFSEFCFPNARFYGLTQEFGTYSNITILKALIKENFYHNYKKDISPEKSKELLLDLFYPKDKVWQKKVLDRGLIIFTSAYNWLKLL